MKKIAFILITLIIASGPGSLLYAGPPQDKKDIREARKREKRAKLEEQFSRTSNLIENKNFVLEAEWLSNQYGSRIPVTPNLNFISVDSSNIVLQIGSNYGIGYNGVGGVTAEGRMTSWKTHRNNKKLSYNIQTNVLTNIGIFDINMTVNADGQATATITSTRRGQLNYTGDIVPLGMSHTYKGQTTY